MKRIVKNQRVKRKAFLTGSRNHAAAVLVLFVAFSLGGCAETEEGVDPHIVEAKEDFSKAPDHVYFLLPHEAEEFQRALMVFKEKMVVKEGRLHVNLQPGREPDIPSRWVSTFYEAIHQANHQLDSGEITLEDLFKTDTVDSRDFFHSPGKTGGEKVPGNWRVTHDGWGLFSIYMSDETYQWVLYGGASSAWVLAQLGGIQPAALLTFATGFYAFHYSLYGQGGGIIIQTWLGLCHWVSYPPPIEMDQEMDQ